MSLAKRILYFLSENYPPELNIGVPEEVGLNSYQSKKLKADRKILRQR